MILRQLLEFAAARYPERVAIADGERSYTYAAWDERVNRVANALSELGVRRGDRVVQVIKNREENCAIHLACQKLGAVNTPINFRWASGEIEFCIDDAEARLVVLEAATAEAVLAARGRCRSDPRLVCVGAVPSFGSAPPPPNNGGPGGPPLLGGGGAGPALISFDQAVAAAPPSRPSGPVDESDIALML